MRKFYASLFSALQAEVTRLMAEHPECHGVEHIARVWRNACVILETEKADAAVVEYAAWLHDIGRLAEFADQGKSCHAAVGAGMVPGILAKIGVDDELFVRHVEACVRTHRYRARNDGPPATLEARIVYDADKLDSMGAIGVGRAFHFAGRIGARVHNSAKQALAADSYSVEDSAYREYLVKLRLLREKLLTRSGKQLGWQRHHYMVAFFRQLAEETGVE